MNRRGYLDWLRGVAVLIMIEGHTVDAWTRAADRTREGYAWAIMVAGIGAPIFLFLAGVSVALAAGARLRRGSTQAEVTRRALIRALQIFGLAFLFRLQAWIVSGGTFADTLLKVDILNVMGLSMLCTAAIWGLVHGSQWRAVCLIMAVIGVAMLTPIMRSAAFLSALPDPVEWYFRPATGGTTFTLFPWAGFLLAGTAVGVWLDRARTTTAERRANVVLGAAGAAVAGAAYAASFLPAIYSNTDFWTGSPTFFFLRLGLVIVMLPAAYAWNAWPGRSPLREFGAASLFVYWIHVEMVYGVPSSAIHRSLTLEQVALAAAAFSLFLFGLVKVKERVGITKLTTIAKDTKDRVGIRALREFRGLRG